MGINPLPLDLVQTKDFQDYLEKIRIHLPVFYGKAPVQEIIDRYSGKISVAEMNQAMETARP